MPHPTHCLLQRRIRDRNPFRLIDSIKPGRRESCSLNLIGVYGWFRPRPWHTHSPWQQIWLRQSICVSRH